MKKIKTKLKDCYILEPDIFGDERGYFSPYFIDKNLEKLGFKKVVQANRSKSAKGVVRGLHFQEDPKCQAKIVEVINGSAIDVVVDIRKNSPSYGEYITVKLTDENNRQLFVPRGFAHGFVSLEDDTVFQYLIDNDYAVSKEGGILWSDPDLNIDWNKIFEENGIDEPVLSNKDQFHPRLKDCKVLFNRPTKYLIIGIDNQLGHDVLKTLNNLGENIVFGLSREVIDITDIQSVEKIITDYDPDVIIHCDSYENIDNAEIDIDNAFLINEIGTKNIVDVTKKIDAKLIYLSTSYVFDGKKDGLIEIDDIPNPLNKYGLSKLRGEEVVKEYEKSFIIRTSWTFGTIGDDFVKRILKLSNLKDTLCIVDDQIGSPTYTIDLAKLIYEMSKTEKYGIYHATNEGFCSLADLASYIFAINDNNTRVIKKTSEKYISLAEIPKNTKLSKKSLIDNGFDLLPDWRDAIDRYCEELNLEKGFQKIKK